MATNLEKLFSASSLVSSTKSSKTIYKKEIFEGCNDKEKKHLRLKLRRHLQKFIASYFTYKQTKQPEKLSTLKKEWLQYAKEVYINTSIIIDGNASEDLQKECKEFLQFIESK